MALRFAQMHRVLGPGSEEMVGDLPRRAGWLRISV